MSINKNNRQSFWKSSSLFIALPLTRKSCTHLFISLGNNFLTCKITECREPPGSLPTCILGDHSSWWCCESQFLGPLSIKVNTTPCAHGLQESHCTWAEWHFTSFCNRESCQGSYWRHRRYNFYWVMTTCWTGTTMCIWHSCHSYSPLNLLKNKQQSYLTGGKEKYI